MKLLFVASHGHTAGPSGGASYTRSVQRRLAMAPSVHQLDALILRAPVAEALPRPALKALSLARSLVNGRSAKSNFSVPMATRAQLRAAINDSRPDLVVINAGDLTPLLDWLPGLPAALIAHNIEHQLVPNPTRSPLAPLLRREARLTAQAELRGLHLARNILTISEDDAAYFRGLGPHMNVATLGPTFDYPAHHRAPRPVVAPLNVGLMARYSWWPNAEAARWFIDEVLRGLPTGTLTLHLFGTDAKAFEGAHPDVRVRGFVRDRGALFDSVDLMICPILSGSGVNIKLAEGLYNHMPTVATPHATRGLAALGGMGLRVLDGAGAWRAFFLSPEAAELATNGVDPKLAGRFAEGGGIDTLDAFLVRAASGGEVK